MPQNLQVFPEWPHGGQQMSGSLKPNRGSTLSPKHAGKLSPGELRPSIPVFQLTRQCREAPVFSFILQSVQSLTGTPGNKAYLSRVSVWSADLETGGLGRFPPRAHTRPVLSFQAPHSADSLDKTSCGECESERTRASAQFSFISSPRKPRFQSHVQNLTTITVLTQVSQLLKRGVKFYTSFPFRGKCLFVTAQ